LGKKGYQVKQEEWAVGTMLLIALLKVE